MTRNRNGGHPHIEDRRELRYENLGLAEAKANLSKLVQEVVSGSEPEIVIAIGGTPVARIVPCRDHPNRALGIDAAAVTLPANSCRTQRRHRHIVRGGRRVRYPPTLIALWPNNGGMK